MSANAATASKAMNDFMAAILLRRLGRKLLSNVTGVSVHQLLGRQSGSTSVSSPGLAGRSSIPGGCGTGSRSREVLNAPHSRGMTNEVNRRGAIARLIQFPASFRHCIQKRRGFAVEKFTSAGLKPPAEAWPVTLPGLMVTISTPTMRNRGR